MCIRLGLLGVFYLRDEVSKFGGLAAGDPASFSIGGTALLRILFTLTSSKQLRENEQHQRIAKIVIML